MKRSDSVPGHYVLIDMVWTLSQRDGGHNRRALTCSTQLKRSVGNLLAESVEGH